MTSADPAEPPQHVKSEGSDSKHGIIPSRSCAWEPFYRSDSRQNRVRSDGRLLFISQSSVKFSFDQLMEK